MKWDLLPKSLHSPRQKVAAPFFSPGHSMTEPQPDEERFPERDLLMAQGQYDQGELSSRPVPHVSTSYLRKRMRRDSYLRMRMRRNGKEPFHHCHFGSLFS